MAGARQGRQEGEPVLQRTDNALTEVKTNLNIDLAILRTATPDQLYDSLRNSAPPTFSEQDIRNISDTFVEIRDKMAELERNGKVNSPEFEQLRVQMLDLGTLASSVLSEDNFAAQESQQLALDALETKDFARVSLNVENMSAFRQEHARTIMPLDEEQQRNLAILMDRRMDPELYAAMNQSGRADARFQIYQEFARSEGLDISDSVLREAAASHEIIVEALRKNAANLPELLAANSWDELTSLATSFMTPGEINSLSSFVEGSTAAMSSPLEQQALMVETFLQALTSFGLEITEEEEELRKDMEKYSDEREKLASDLEEAKVKFAKGLMEMGDEGGLRFIAQALEGNAAPGSVEWDNFWTKDRALAFKNALKG
ncbi:MAG: hypothetical protein WC350_00055 [Candidatus Micrarchaeia archaeon]|jgi:hypothetical protein